MEKISETILKFLRLDTVVQNLTGYVEARFELMKVEIREDVSRAIAKGIVTVVLFLTAFLFLIFISIGLAQFLNKYFEGSSIGYWTVAGVYGATFLLLMIFRKGINTYFERQLSELIKPKEKP